MDNTYKKDKDRQQTLLFLPNLDDLLTKDNPVRGIDSDMLDVFKLGFNNKTSTVSGGARESVIPFIKSNDTKALILVRFSVLKNGQ